MSTEKSSRYLAAYPSIAPSLPGQDLTWLNRLRQDALKKFSERGFPSPREEEWRYTNVSGIEKMLFTPSLASAAGHIDRARLEEYRLKDCWSVVLVNGHFSPELSAFDGLPDAVTVAGLAEALAERPDQVKRYFGQAVNDSEHGFVAFNTAWFTGGLFLHVPAGQILAKPVQLLHIVTEAELLATTRTIIAIDDMAEAQVIETFAGRDQSYLTASVSEVFVGQNAGLTLYKLQSESDKAYHFGGVYIKQARDARLNHHNFAFGGLLARSDIHTDLGRGSACEFNGLYLGGKRQHIDNHTRINHFEPHATSRELYKGVLDDRARGVFQGRVIVAENAQKTDSEMSNRNLLLSENAEIDTKPQLEIYADDVKCGHGVTVGQLDEKSVFYLQSRGVDEESARNMLTFAFANEMVGKIGFDALRDRVLGQLLARFPQHAIEKEWL
ncbi:MAG: Fe-S cluster assembly protein SufD [Gammaproteobacteria bacterium]